MVYLRDLDLIVQRGYYAFLRKLSSLAVYMLGKRYNACSIFVHFHSICTRAFASVDADNEFYVIAYSLSVSWEMAIPFSHFFR